MRSFFQLSHVVICARTPNGLKIISSHRISSQLIGATEKDRLRSNISFWFTQPRYSMCVCVHLFFVRKSTKRFIFAVLFVPVAISKCDIQLWLIATTIIIVIIIIIRVPTSANFPFVFVLVRINLRWKERRRVCVCGCERAKTSSNQVNYHRAFAYSYSLTFAIFQLNVSWMQVNVSGDIFFFLFFTLMVNEIAVEQFNILEFHLYIHEERCDQRQTVY